MKDVDFKHFQFYVLATYMAPSIFMNYVYDTHNDDFINMWLHVSNLVNTAKDKIQVQIASQLFRALLKMIGVYVKEDGNYDLDEGCKGFTYEEWKFYPFDHKFIRDKLYGDIDYNKLPKLLEDGSYKV